MMPFKCEWELVGQHTGETQVYARDHDAARTAFYSTPEGSSAGVVLRSVELDEFQAEHDLAVLVAYMAVERLGKTREARRSIRTTLKACRVGDVHIDDAMEHFGIKVIKGAVS